MGRNKLAKFAEMEHFSHVFQPSFRDLQEKGFPLKGSWASAWFENNHPVTIEFGCGKGEYTVSLAAAFSKRNFVGVDIKGARIHTGARLALENNLKNAAFVRTKIENANYLFGPDEVDEIWLTFPDPQMKNPGKRLTSPEFLFKYSQFLQPGGIIHLKTDSAFLYSYTLAIAELNHLEIMAQTTDLHASDLLDEVLSIRTYYEKQWMERGIAVKYLSFIPGKKGKYLAPEEEILERDSYRSFGRTVRNYQKK